MNEELPLEPILISAEEYEWLLNKLEEPPQVLPALHELLTDVPVWNG